MIFLLNHGLDFEISNSLFSNVTISRGSVFVYLNMSTQTEAPAKTRFDNKNIYFKNQL